MLDKETSDKLYTNVLKRFTRTLPSDSSTDRFTEAMIELAAKVAIITLEEYEKLHQ